MFFFFKARQNTGNTKEEDRRVFARMKAAFSLRCIEQESERPGMTFDVSAQGLGIIAENKIKPFSQVRIFLTLPETHEEFITKGMVVWCRKAAGRKFHLGVSLDKPELMIVSQLLNGLPKACS